MREEYDVPTRRSILSRKFTLAAKQTGVVSDFPNARILVTATPSWLEELEQLLESWLMRRFAIFVHSQIVGIFQLTPKLCVGYSNLLFRFSANYDRSNL